MKKRVGFTLAEVLITLTIIGVIAALTIPTLMQKNQEHTFIQKLKKNYSILSNAYAQAIRENGTPDEWDIGPYNSATGAKKLASYITPYLKISRECTINKPCFTLVSKALFADKSFFELKLQNNNRYQVQLEDGTSVDFWTNGTGPSYGAIIVDLNNLKEPNKFGVDIFSFSIRENKLVPVGTGCPKLICDNGTRCVYKDTHNRNGGACGMHVIYKGNMDYLRRDISSEW